MKKKVDKKLFFSFLIGIIGIISLTFNFLWFWHGLRVGEFLLEILPVSLADIYLFYIEHGFIIFFFLSPLGIFWGFKSFKISKRKLAIFAIFFNLINLIFSLILAYFVIGLATGPL